jgi:hypothetical protein
MASAFPVPAPADDSRFTFGLLLELAKVIEQHGYPPIAAGADLVRLQQSVFGFLYAQASTTELEGVLR